MSVSYQIGVGDALHLPLPDKSVDLIITSPPYEDNRCYGEVGFALSGSRWVDWCTQAFIESFRVCKGLVAFVVEGKTRNYKWSATPALLMAQLHQRGYCLRKPPVYARNGIPGSGGPDWLRNDYEFIICATETSGRLPWSDNKACGKPPKYERGGEASYRTRSGDRINSSATRLRATSGMSDGDIVTRSRYIHPNVANPGNIIRAQTGGGKMGSKFAHMNEAPFSQKLADFFVKSFSPLDGVVLDQFCGSGTTGASALLNGRNFIGFDIRESQISISLQRLEEEVMPYIRG